MRLGAGKAGRVLGCPLLLWSAGCSGLGEPLGFRLNRRASGWREMLVIVLSLVPKDVSSLEAGCPSAGVSDVTTGLTRRSPSGPPPG